MRRPLLQCLLLASLIALTAVPLDAQIQLTGRVIENETEEPVAGARVEIFTTNWFRVRERVTDDRGRFEATLPRPGSYRIRVSRIGYQRVDAPVLRTDEVSLLGIELRMSPEAIPLAPLEIVARTGRERRTGDLDSFDHRRETGLGHFFTRDDIERIQPSRVSDLLARVPGVRVQSSGGGFSRMVTMGRASRPGGCPVQLFVDGLLVNRATPGAGQIPQTSIDDVVAPGGLEAVEVYRGLSSVPAAFLTPESRCGVVVVWTRRGRG